MKTGMRKRMYRKNGKRASKEKINALIRDWS